MTGLVLLALALGAVQGPRTVRVEPAGGVARIAEAVARARAGDTILLRAGTWREPTIALDRPLTLLGEPGAILDGEGRRALLLVTADDVTVAGLVLRNTGMAHSEDRAAIRVQGARRCVIRDNRIERAFFAIYLADTRNCRVEDNVVVGPADRESRAGNAIHLWNAGATVVARNRLTGHRDGIYLEFSEDARIHDNISTGHARYGLHFMFSHGASYERNLFARNGAGVAVMYTRDVVMRGNEFRDNWGPAAYGLLLKDITDSRIEDNRFVGNTVGLWSEGSARLVVTGNLLQGNGWAVRLMASTTASEFRGNVFGANTFDVAAAGRRHTSTFEGNWWEAYRGYDLDRDGRGDVPHHPVRLVAAIVARYPGALVLLRSPFLDLLDVGERVMPVLTPVALVDARPLMRRPE